MKSSDIRKKFLKYFEKKNHKILPSSSLIPADPTVLLTLAGMLQFKPIFLGEEKPKYKTVTTCQKCMRMIDIENVGKTPRHHTFFEMLGNFSFGDYFKKEAIAFAWDFLTNELNIDKTRLSAAVFKDDDEAYDIWVKDIGLDQSKVFRLDEENNFWSAGPTGPCGPCSEIYWDMGKEFGCNSSNCSPGCECDRFLEIWNLVFIEFNRDEKGCLNALPSKNIDTGMGLERITSVIQGVKSNFDTDLFIPILNEINKIAEKKSDIAIKVIADHIRSITYLIADGVIPSNEGRGYVLRRLIRRGVRFGKTLGIEKQFLAGLSGVVINLGKDFYPEIGRKKDYISKIIASEEESFSVALNQGLLLISEIINSNKKNKIISGTEAFKLHDTYGFPLELTQEIALESGFEVDNKQFEIEMEAQRKRARNAGTSKDKPSVDMIKFSELPATKFFGYENLQIDSKIVELLPDENLVVLEKTPFYPEGGGQVSDKGSLSFNGKEVKVVAVYGSIGNVIVHKVESTENLKKKMTVKATVDAGKRFMTAKHHTSTHLLHKALRETIGDQAQQTGSFVGPDYFRFDYTHNSPLTDDQISEIELIVNQKIRQDLKVETFETTLEEAKKSDAIALFGEKYGSKVRMLKIGSFSNELCGGTHVKHTGVIELFKIRSESSIASGVRRIDAIAGSKVIEHVLSLLDKVCKENVDLICACKSCEFKKEQLGGQPLRDFDVFEITIEEVNTVKKALRNKDLVGVDKFLGHMRERNERLKDRIESIGKSIKDLSSKKINEQLPILISNAEKVKNVKIIGSSFKDIEKEAIRSLCDKVLSIEKSSAMIFGSVVSDKPLIVCCLSKDLVDKGLNASEIVKKAGRIIGGGGGGKPNLAEAGGKDPGNIDEAVAFGLDLIKQHLENK